MSIQDIRNIFAPNRTGRLMKIEENEQTRYQFEIWFEYTRQAMMELKEGTLLAVKNFASNQNETHYSILEITSIMPIHYALGDNLEGYPGFVMEAARNIATDWTSQESVSEEDTTIIRCIATPTELGIVESISERRLEMASTIPMVGSDAKVLTSEVSQEIVNREISPAQDEVFEIGMWLVDDNIPIYVRAEDFIRLHFGIFGFTGVGKSNLVSTLIAKLLETANTSNNPVKIVIFDLMSEYTSLLVDQLVQIPDAYLLAIREYTLPRRVIEILNGDNSQRESAINDFVNTTLFPKPINHLRNFFREAFATLLDNNKVRIYQEPTRTFRDFLRENEHILTRGNLGGSREIIYTFIDNMETLGDQSVTPDILQAVISAINQITRPTSSQSRSGGLDFYINGSRSTTRESRNNEIVERLLSGINLPTNLTPTAINNLREFRRKLEAELRSPSQRTYPENVRLTLEDIINDLNDSSHSSLYIIQSHNPDDLRDFAYTLGKELFESRRRDGTISPLVSFVFDEADEFIPQQAERDSSYARSAWIVEMLARRGRKFGIGIGICTQRTRLLRTSVMAQPHTYLVSKLPRLSDRQAVQEAFGFSEEMFRQTFKFVPGDWLLASYDATGLKGVPIPIHAENANERIYRFLTVMGDEA